MAKKRIAILFGGTSPEHDVSCMSAVWLMENLSAEYEAVLIGITRKGRMLYYPGDAEGIRAGGWEHHPDCCGCVFSIDSSKQGIYKLLDDQTASFLNLDCVFPVLYGKSGEDGSIQGVLERSGIPFVGSGTCASALCMDKEFVHMVLNAAGVRTCAWFTVRRSEKLDAQALADKVEASFGFPVYVKPANANAAGGIFHAENAAELERAVKLAFVHDDKVLVKEQVYGIQVKCGVIGNESPEASLLGEIAFSESNAVSEYERDIQQLVIPARIGQELSYKIREIAVQIFKVMECAGMASVDFFVTPAGDIYFNQINTVPGFSDISIFPRLWKAVGVGSEQLLDRLVNLAFDRAGVDY
ncbi:MAG: D-alanine--D-alanine ligase [Oscillospiraceae bacterium]|nr:D-alanine--D-alanine ligase [Oscillospiraceae bacterium]